jgi:two-component system CitB family sensor kinase
VTDPISVNTVVGDLVDNALHAARMRSPAAVEIALLADGATLHMSVADSGPGVAAELRETLFDEGVSTKITPGPARPRTGKSGDAGSWGDVWLADPGGAESGARFVAALPGMLSSSGKGEP